MAKIFISYSRANRDQMQSFTDELATTFIDEGIFYDKHITGGAQWWTDILRRIGEASVFVYLITNESLASYACRAEYLEAMRLGKHIVPIDLTDDIDLSYTDSPLAFILSQLQRLQVDQTNLIIREIERGLNRPNANAYRDTIHNMRDVHGETVNIGSTIHYHINYVMESNTTPVKQPDTGQAERESLEAERKRLARERADFERQKRDFERQQTKGESQAKKASQTSYIEAQRIASTPAKPNNPKSTKKSSFSPILRAGMILVVGSVIIFGSLLLLPMLGLFAGGGNERGNPDSIPTERITRNADWTPIERDFDGVKMMLVPAGCFMMGSNHGDSDEMPIHEQCFDEPFWIDKYEVTNEQMDSSGCPEYSSEENQPRNCIRWFGAKIYCAERGARLPTEAEWEYAARGPDNLIYPWGNNYDSANVIGADDLTYGETKTAPVNSRINGASWVGAQDMSGNLWEWVSSPYLDYPYSEDNEDQEGINNNNILRGGSFQSTSNDLRSANRFDAFSTVGDYDWGFRCARD